MCASDMFQVLSFLIMVLGIVGLAGFVATVITVSINISKHPPKTQTEGPKQFSYGEHFMHILLIAAVSMTILGGIAYCIFHVALHFC